MFLKFAKLWELNESRPPNARKAQSPKPRAERDVLAPHRHRAHLAWRAGPSHAHGAWACARMRQRAALVAHPEGELFRRMSEGTDLIPLAPRNEIDLAAAWRLSRVLKQLRPDVVHAHDPHGVAMAATAFRSRRRSPEPPLVASRRIEFRIAHNSFSRWKYGQVACFIAISEAVRDRLIARRHPEAEDHRRQRRR